MALFPGTICSNLYGTMYDEDKVHASFVIKMHFIINHFKTNEVNIETMSST